MSFKWIIVRRLVQVAVVALIAYLRGVPVDAWAVRLPAFLAGVLLVPATFLLGRRISCHRINGSGGIPKLRICNPGLIKPPGNHFAVLSKLCPHF